MKKCIIFLLLWGVLSNESNAQQVYTQTLSIDNFIDSVGLRKYKKKINHKKITIERNHIVGIASFYSRNLDNTLTTTGEHYKNVRYTAACNLYKLNTIVRVTNLKNGHSVLVRVNDRMHPAMLRLGRVIDLSRVAAKSLKLNNANGLVKVSVDAIGYSKENPKEAEQSDN
jgi:rare lipoprotein A (peptidoglycan hydrolase)